jgi:hypothetical protein
VPETRRLQTCAAQKGRSFPKEATVRWPYEGRGPGLHVPSINTDRGAHHCGKPKSLETRRQRETNMHAINLRIDEVRSPKRPGVTVVKTRNRAI